MLFVLVSHLDTLSCQILAADGGGSKNSTDSFQKKKKELQ
jgi:hypothetical protein